MSDALFFTGQVLKNNRNLIQEEATRQQLAIQKEELELQRQESIRRRKDARSKGVEAESYEVSGMDPFLQEQFQTQVGDYQRFVSENSISIYDGDINLRNQKDALERGLSSSKNLYDNLSDGLTSLNNAVLEGRGNTLKLAEDGETYLYQYNYNKIKEEVNSGNMTLEEALRAYSIDPTSMIKKSDFIPFYNNRDLYFENDDKNFRVVIGVDENGYNITEIDPNRKKVTTNEIISKLKVNANNKHNDSNAAAVYKNEQIEVDGVRIPAMDAFFEEAYVDPDTGVIGGVVSPSVDLIEQLDPESDKFNKELSDKYAEYLGQKIADRGYKDRDQKRGKKATTDTERKRKEREAAQNKYNVDTYNYMQNNEAQDKHRTGVSQYTGESTSKSITGSDIKVKVSAADLHRSISDESVLAFKERQLERMGQIKGEEGSSERAEYDAIIADNSNFTGIEVNLIEVALDGSGEPIGVVQLGGEDGPKVVVPWDQLTSAEHDTALKQPGVQQLINYQQPQLKTEENSGEKKKTPISPEE